MKVELTGAERESIAMASAAVRRVFDFCSAMLSTPGIIPEDACDLADIHATAAGLDHELGELVSMIDKQNGDE